MVNCKGEIFAPILLASQVRDDHVFRRCFLMLGKAVDVVTKSVPKVRVGVLHVGHGLVL